MKNNWPPRHRGHRVEIERVSSYLCALCGPNFLIFQPKRWDSAMSDQPKNYTPHCRFCQAQLHHTFVDLGTSPLCQRHVTPAQFNHAESFYPLHVYVCEKCFLVQLPQYVAREEIFDAQYGYFSSYSDTMLRHAQAY